jgi:tetratricopeptide (TPR) repeat protein
MSDKPKRKLGWRLLRWGLISLAVFVTLAAALVTEENWRCKRAWENYKREAQARNERFDLASLVPPVPDDQNFFCAPIVAAALEALQNQNPDSLKPHGTNSVNRMDFNIYRGNSGNWPTNGGNRQTDKLTDLKPWQNYFRKFAETPEGRTNGFPVAAQPQTSAADVLLALGSFHPALEELRQASLRPYARIPLNYDNIFDSAGELLPWLANMKRCAQFLQLRILAELEDGQSEAALKDVELLLRLTDCGCKQPFLISYLVRIAMTAIDLQPIYEGLAQHRWSDAQLAELQQVLAGQDYLADWEFATRGEKITALATFENQRITRESKQWEESSGTNKLVTISYRFVPSAYFYGNELAFARMHRQFIVPLIDLTNRVVAPAALRQAKEAMQPEKKRYSYYQLQARMVFPAIAAVVTKVARIQSQVDLARVACALERFQLAHGNYPEILDALSPQFIEKLPHDLINGQPLHYRRTEDGRYTLYSIGWDEKDDGGKIFITKSGTVDQNKGDWVWRYPPQ